AFLAVAIIPARVIAFALTKGPVYAKFMHQPWPHEPELVGILTDNIALAVGRPFRGAIDFVIPDVTSEPFTIATLWSHAIPTLYEYGQLTTPVWWYFGLKVPDPGARRNYWSVLPMLGARYTAVLEPLPEDLAAGLSLTTAPHQHVGIHHPKPGPWRLYELPHPNVGDYSPVDVVTATSGDAITRAMSKEDFDFTRQVVLEAPVQAQLVPAHDARMSIIRGGLHVSGKSDGTSLLLLPQQFSHCLRAHDPKVQLLRANLVLTGVMFSGEVDTDISFDYGILSPACRRADLSDFKRLDARIEIRLPHLKGDHWFLPWNEAVDKFWKIKSALLP